MKISYVACPKTDTHSALAEAFGIFAEKEVVIFEGDLPGDYNLLYLTGESGAGKSSILRALGGDNLPTPEDETLVADIGLEEVSLLGLGDAALFFTPFKNLSDSQQFRARIAYALAQGQKEIRVDEFLSTLDRLTAKSVAFNVQRACRKRGVRLVVATAHEDLEDALGPDVILRGRSFPSRWSVEAPGASPRGPEPVIRSGSAKDYGASPLGDIHYRGKHTGGIKDVLFASVDGVDVGVLVGTYRRHDGGRRISRLIVHPTYRGLGIGKSLVKNYLASHPTADTVAAMAEYSPVFERAGMVLGGWSETKPPAKMTADLISAGFDVSRWASRRYCEEFVKDHPGIIPNYPSAVSSYVAPGGVRLAGPALAEKLRSDPDTQARVLWLVRPHKYPRYRGA